MVIFSYSTLRDFFYKHPDSKEALIDWFKTTEKESFSTFHDLKQKFNSVDSVGNDLYIFNIRGNKYRLVTRIHFDIRTVYIRFIGTHQQYDKINIRSL
ncbi:type II toxin-antitoxin system HigB family toxin [Dyadobacter jiangsuensis]|uniref:type II toxin-antitoxin system HigB family toxin n=1 Tax=Dyadobacter fermentans TaxID=94254 RepID=UPI001CBE5101|nr:type II toxin-antitoxin system HigB family toxin [Dyadobacter fermentans]MBZ1358573.1 type II toxin-antitoxin system HigB family toxin [Dyadobacter fermentans]